MNFSKKYKKITTKTANLHNKMIENKFFLVKIHFQHCYILKNLPTKSLILTTLFAI